MTPKIGIYRALDTDGYKKVRCFEAHCFRGAGPGSSRRTSRPSAVSPRMRYSGNGHSRRSDMNDQQAGDIGIIKPGFDHYDDPLVDVKIIHDAAHEGLSIEGTMSVQSEIVDSAAVFTSMRCLDARR